MKRKLAVPALLLAVLMLFASCSTTIRATIERPAELNLNGAKSIAVLPFQASEGGVSQGGSVLGDVIGFFSDVKNRMNGAYDAADYLTTGLEKAISTSGYLDLIQSAAVKAALTSRTTVPCDVYLTGNISRFENRIQTTKRTVKEGGVKTEVDYYYRDVTFTLTYQIVDSVSNRVIAVKSTDVSSRSSEEKLQSDVPDVMNTIRDELDYTIRTIMKQIQPYKEIKTLTLLKDKSNDPDMKTADELVKEGLLDSGRTMFLILYEARGYFEAGYNAAIILEAQGKLDEAYEEMQALVLRFGDKRAVTALGDIQFEINSRDALKEQLESR